jgi:hypothetical protein
MLANVRDVISRRYACMDFVWKTIGMEKSMMMYT